MKVLVTGATGFIGQKLVKYLIKENYDVVAISRNRDKAHRKLPYPIEVIECDLTQEEVDASQLEGVDAIVHLLGENIGHGRWDAQQKQVILNSRNKSTTNIVKAANLMNIKYFIGASAIGFYQDNDADEFLDETTPAGSHFLSHVCQKWEEPYHQLKAKHLILRIGVVLGHEGGLIKEVLPVYRKGLGGKLAHGQQWMSWIHIEDLVGLLAHHLKQQKLTGIQNAVAPKPCQNETFNKVMSQYCQRPAFLNAPAWALKLMMGNRSYLALSSQRIQSKSQCEYQFKFKNIDQAIKNLCHFEKLPPQNKEGFHYSFEDALFIPKSKEEVFIFFSEAKNLEKITPPLLNFKIHDQSTQKIDEGTEFVYKLKVHGIPMRWKTVITNWKENELFTDYQQKGPYRVWYHTHRFIPCRGGVLMLDEVKYALPFGYIGELFSKALVEADIKKIFSYRSKVIKEVFNFE